MKKKTQTKKSVKNNKTNPIFKSHYVGRKLNYLFKTIGVVNRMYLEFICRYVDGYSISGNIIYEFRDFFSGKKFNMSIDRELKFYNHFTKNGINEFGFNKSNEIIFVRPNEKSLTPRPHFRFIDKKGNNLAFIKHKTKDTIYSVAVRK